MLRKVLALTIAAPLLMGNSAAGPFTINVTGLESTKGRLVACLWTEKKKFPTCEKSKSTIRKTVKITGSSMKVRFPNVKPGTYAVTVHHDADSNGRLKTNFIGMPKEGVGVSNNPSGIPRFKSSLVRIKANTSISVRMRYL